MSLRSADQKVQHGLEGKEKKLDSEGKRHFKDLKGTKGFKERNYVVRRTLISIAVFLLDWRAETLRMDR